MVAVRVERLFSYQTAKMRLSGLGSFLYIMFNDPECDEVNVCTTNKSHRAAGAGRGRPIFDVNTKLAAGR